MKMHMIPFTPPSTSGNSPFSRNWRTFFGGGRHKVFQGTQQGNFAVMFALTLMLVLTLITYVLDTGFFLMKKNRYQASAEAAALAAVNQVCFVSSMAGLKEIVRNVVQSASPSLEDTDVIVETGYYDAFDEYFESFPVYKDFIASGTEGYPDRESWNAVMVTIQDKVNSLTGFQSPKEIRGAAVAYLPRVSMVARSGTFMYRYSAPNNIPPITFHSGNLFAKEQIDIRGRLLFDQCEYATSTQGSLPEMPIIQHHLMDTERLVQHLIKKADRTYTLSDVNKDAFYAKVLNSYLFDFTYAHDDHEIIFLDVPEHAIVHINPFPEMVRDPISYPIPYETTGTFTIKKMTIVTRADVEMRRYSEAVTLGGSDFDQLNIVTPNNISMNMTLKNIRGLNLVCGSLLLTPTPGTQTVVPFPVNYMRVISDTEISITLSSSITPLDVYFKFGPPCPPMSPPVLGRLEPGSD